MFGSVLRRTCKPLFTATGANVHIGRNCKNVASIALTHFHAPQCTPKARAFSCWAMGAMRAAMPMQGMLHGAARMGATPVARVHPNAIIQRSMANARHKKMIKLAKGYRNRANCYSVAVQRVHKARQYAYRDRKVKKRDFRSLWIQRINAGVRQYNYFPYSVFMNRLKTQDVQLNRKVLADMAVSEPLSFRSVVEVANAAAKASAKPAAAKAAAKA